MIHRQASQTRAGEWGDVTVVCSCGEWQVTRPTSWQAMAAFEAHSRGRSEPTLETPRAGHGDGARFKGALGVAVQQIRARVV